MSACELNTEQQEHFMNRRRLTPEERQHMQQESLNRARSTRPGQNWASVIRALTDKGIDFADIIPGENVLTFNAWKALGRSVKKGEHGVRIPVFVSGSSTTETTNEQTTNRRSTSRKIFSAVVFHISQTQQSPRTTPAVTPTAIAPQTTPAASQETPGPVFMALFN